MDVLKEQQQCPPAAVSAIIDMVGAVFAHRGKPLDIDIDDIEQLIELLHVVRPACAELAFFDGLLHAQRQEWDRAEEIFRALIARSLCLPASKGMLLRCLKEQQAFGWKDEAKRLLEDDEDDDNICRLARAYIARDDLKHAAADAKRTGRFVTPESVLALDNPQPKHGGDRKAAASRQSNCDMLMTMQYLRV
ncbi:MAG: type secretion protein HrpB1 [Paraburkholderia sp.]|nr:type secretion protein HrpB1 [Paraburkholderia sp.]